jgi:predicted nucleotide-binding protein (sugar kinase/HSP70/actin superfamily)
VIADYINPRAIIITPEMVSQSKIDKAVEDIPDADTHLWHLERQVLGAGLHLINSGKVDKVINVTAFGCGTSLVTEPYLTTAAEDAGIPFLNLIIDEHTGEAGILTRLEAFIDTSPFDAEPPVKNLVPIHIEKRVIGYPSMGHVDIGFDSFFADSGVDFITSPRTTPAIVELGRDIAPEFACFPFVSTLGQMQNLLDNGANTILMVGGKGLCRLGWYGQIQELLLRRSGRNFDMVIADSFLPLFDKFPAFISNIGKITNNAPWYKSMPAFLFALDKIRTADRIVEQVRYLRAYEDVRGTADALLKKYFTNLRQISANSDLKRFISDTFLELASVPKSETNPLKVRLTGEIWVLLEQEATNYLERWLATAMPHRVLVDCRHSVTGWYDDHVLGKGMLRQQRLESQKAAEKWLAYPVGGHGLESVGDVVLASKEDIDGVVHIFPFTCMPEIVAQNIIVSVSEALDIPVLTYIISEQTGEAGMATRLEAFLDVLEARKNAEN